MDQEIIGMINPMDNIFLNRDALTVFPCVAFGLYVLLSMA